MTACTYGPDGKLAVAGCADGSIHLWAQAVLTRTLAVLRPAHSGPISGLAVSEAARPGGCLASRGAGVLLLWSLADIAKMGAASMQPRPAAPFMRAEAAKDAKGVEGGGVTPDLSHPHSSAGVEFSPDGRLVLVGTAAQEADDEAKALLCFFEVKPPTPGCGGSSSCSGSSSSGSSSSGAGGKSSSGKPAPPPLPLTVDPSLCLAVQVCLKSNPNPNPNPNPTSPCAPTCRPARPSSPSSGRGRQTRWWWARRWACCASSSTPPCPLRARCSRRERYI